MAKAKEYEPTIQKLTGKNQPYPETVRHPGTGELIPFEEAARLPDEERNQIWYLIEFEDGRQAPRWPFRVDSFNFFEKPLRELMARRRLEEMGSSDETLEKQRAELFGKRIDGEPPPLKSSAEDTPDMQAERRRVFDLVMGRLYS